MVDFTQINASISTSAIAQGQASALPLGKVVEAKVLQILSEGFIRFATPQGQIDLQVPNASLQVGSVVKLELSQNGAILLSLPTKDAPITTQSFQTQTAPAASQNAQPNSQVQNSPTVVTTLSTEAEKLLTQNQGNTVARSFVQNADTSPQKLTQPSLAPQATTAGQASAIIAPQATELSKAISQALQKQDTVGSLLNNLNGLVSPIQGGSGKLLQLPQQLQSAITQVLNTQVPLNDTLNVVQLQQAIEKSGIFLEGKLAAGQNPNTTTNLSNTVPTQAAQQQPDLKAALLNLSQVVKQLSQALPPAFIPPQAPLEKRNAAPPKRGEPPAPQKIAEANLSPRSTLPEVLQTVGDQTDAALSKLRLMQVASQPLYDTSSMPMAERALQAQAWHVEVPLNINGQANTLQMVIEREAARKDASAQNRKWRLRFAINLDELGAIHALLVLHAGAVGVTLWAEQDDTLHLFQEFSSELRSAIEGDALEVTELDLRSGKPLPQRPSSNHHVEATA